MRHSLRALLCAATVTLSATPLVLAADALPPAASQPAKAPSRQIEVCFVLDTTGSMGGLIDGAKKKIWTIANSIVAADPKASVRFALVPYRDRGDQYIPK